MRRIEDVLDVWFDSGSMPFAQVHYPFENQDWFDSHNPADFIVEYIGQTRGWFYILHVLSTALFDRPAYKNVHQPRHRARQRRPEDVQVAAQLPRRERGLRPRRLGCHALVPDVLARCCAAATSSSPRRASARASARCMLPLWSTWYFFSLYANASGTDGYEATLAHRLRPMCSTGTSWRRPRDLVEDVTGRPRAARQHARRRQAPRLRRRADQLVRAPLARPVLGWRRCPAEHRRVRHALHRARDGHPGGRPAAAARVRGHLAGSHRRPQRAPRDWPDAASFPADHDLVVAMDQVRAISSTALSPAQAGRAAGAPAAGGADRRHDEHRRSGRIRGILRDELNVKSVTFVELAEESAAAYGITAPAQRQRAGRRPAARQERAAGDPGRPRRRLERDGRHRHRRRHRARPAASTTSRSRPAAPAAPTPPWRCSPAAASCCSTPRRPPSSTPRDSPGTSSGPCRTPASPRGSR